MTMKTSACSLLPALLLCALMLQGCGGMYSPDEFKVEITAPPADAVVEPGTPVDFKCDVSGGNGPFTFVWNFDGQAPDAAVQNPFGIVFGSSGSYAVHVTASDDAREDASDTRTVTVNARPAVDSVSVPSGQQTGDIEITYDLSDSEGDICSIDVEYCGGSAGSDWTPATVAGAVTGLTPGTGLTVTWNSAADEFKQHHADYRIRIRAHDGFLSGNWSEPTDMFEVDNPVNFIIIDTADNSLTEKYTVPDIDTNDEYKTVKIVLTRIETGSYDMGDETGDGDSHELPVHTVTIAQHFYMGVFEITQRQWYEVAGTWPSWFSDDPDKRPVENITWNECSSFLTPLNTVIEAGEIRLPSEAEWEYACKAGTHTKYSYGDTPDGDYMWYHDNSDTGNGRETHEVGTKLPNPQGLYDMHGNVWEWCEDDYHTDYSGAPADGSAWTDDPRSDARILRGASWHNTRRYLSSSSRYGSGVEIH